METADIVIIGGGVLGAAVTYYLSKFSPGRVVVLERHSVGQQNSSLAAGLLTTARFKPDLIRMVKETYQAIDEIEAATGESLGVHRTGCLYAATSLSQQEKLRHMANLASGAGLAVEWLDRVKAMKMIPWLWLPEAATVMVMPADGYVDGYSLARGYMRAARSAGVEVREGMPVLSLQQDGDRVTGVTTNDASISAPIVIDAAGVWAGMLARAIGIHLPMAPIRSQYWISAGHPDFSPEQPFVILPDAKSYARPESSGLLFGLRESVSVGVNPQELPETMSGYVINRDSNGWPSLEEGIPALAEFFPLVRDIEIRHYVSGLSNYTPDGMYVLGGVSGVEGFLAATGCSGAGVAMSGGIGRAVAELAVGSKPFVDLTPHRVDRFGSIDPTDADFMRQCGEARSGKITG